MTAHLRELLGLTGSEAAELAKTADAETQAEVVFLLKNIKGKEGRKLLAHIKRAGCLDAIREDYEEYRRHDAATLSSIVSAGGSSLRLSALVAAVAILQAVSDGTPLRVDFPAQSAAAHEIQHDDAEWVAAQVAALTDDKKTVTVSEWAESKRYLPPQVTSMPGFYSFDVAPYLREIADSLSASSPVRVVDVKKAAQIGATVGVLENAIGYVIDHVQSAPVMLLTADAELAQIRVNQYITPMLQHSGLAHLIRSSDANNKRKTGKTKDRIEWAGGGFMVPFGARNADKLRSTSVQYLLQDEVDAFPDKVGRDGDPQKLAEARTKAYFETRKILRISTPLVKGSSRIERGFLSGDQRHYFVPCKKCGQYQTLVFRGGGRGAPRYGLTWETDETTGALLPDTVRYVCRYCGHPHRNADKAWMLPRGEWRPTATPDSPDHRSYHIPALLSPIGMYPWEAIARDWQAAWDDQNEAVRDVGLLQEFYNNVLGEPFEIISGRIRFQAVSAHRRAVYRMGEIPNDYARTFCGSRVLFLACLVDVHKSNLAVAVFGWTRDARCFLIEYARLEDDDCSEIGSKVWGQLRQIIEERVYRADDGTTYKIAVTLIDAGYSNDTVVTFCADYASGVYPVVGRDRPAKQQSIKEFAEFKTQQGTVGYRILVDHYKDRLAPVLRRDWVEESGEQRPWHFNAPVDVGDKALKELTVEVRKERTDASGHVSYYWHRPGNARNELWDLLVYGHAAVEILAWNICVKHFDAPSIDWPEFWGYLEREQLFYEPPQDDE